MYYTNPLIIGGLKKLLHVNHSNYAKLREILKSRCATDLPTLKLSDSVRVSLAFSGHVVAAEGPREHQVCRQMAGDAASRAQAAQAGARDQGRVAKPVLVCGVCVCVCVSTRKCVCVCSYQEVCVCVCMQGCTLSVQLG